MNTLKQNNRYRKVAQKIHVWLLLILLLLAAISQVAVGEGQAQEYVPCQTYWGTNQYIEYIAGNLPIIISAPHGGDLEPSEIPRRTCSSSIYNDYRSQEYTREVVDYLQRETGGCPHVIINRLHRNRLDANRTIETAACGNRRAEQAWYEFHAFIEAAQATVTAQYGKGLYLDFHTNGHHDGKWVEIGMILSASDLARSDASLAHNLYKDRSSIRSLGYTPDIYFPEVVRGQTSMGGLLQARKFKAVPSPAYPDPGGLAYYRGGHNVLHHGSLYGGTIDGIQVETYGEMLNDNVRDAFSRVLADSIVVFVETHYGFSLEKSHVYHLPLVLQQVAAPSYFPVHSAEHQE